MLSLSTVESCIWQRECSPVRLNSLTSRNRPFFSPCHITARNSVFSFDVVGLGQLGHQLDLEFDRKAYDWAQYKRNERGHNNGNHINCDPRRCDARSQIESANQAHLDAVAVFDELARHHLDAREYFGDDYDSMRELADMEFPDFLQQDVDFVHRLRAKADVREYQLKLSLTSLGVTPRAGPARSVVSS